MGKLLSPTIESSSDKSSEMELASRRNQAWKSGNIHEFTRVMSNLDSQLLEELKLFDKFTTEVSDGNELKAVEFIIKEKKLPLDDQNLTEYLEIMYHATEEANKIAQADQDQDWMSIVHI